MIKPKTIDDILSDSKMMIPIINKRARMLWKSAFFKVKLINRISGMTRDIVKYGTTTHVLDVND
jgi:hypothetical protein